MTILVHLVYIHGFQGDDTSFQSFPLHLQEKLSASIPRDLSKRVRFQSSLYPTYRSVKPIAHATKNFLAWLSTQPEGPVILLAHSMGGLLAADAATDPSNIGRDGKPSRIVGVIAFDVPFLGMHPHVVISGIASLLPKDSDGKKNQTEEEMNRHPQIQIVDSKATDEWEAFKSKIQSKLRRRSQVVSNSPDTLEVPRSPISSLSEPSSPRSSISLRNRSPSPSYYDKAVDLLAAHSKAKDEDSLVRWLRKHADSPFSAGKRWLVERFQFGSCMVDPSDLGDRYDRLVDWNGLWVNYWTYTGGNPAVGREADLNRADELDNDAAILDVGVLKKKLNGLRKSREVDLQEVKSSRSVRHFIVLPTGLGRILGGAEHWEKVAIAGVEDEVAAHTGLFIPKHNLDYINFVDRIAGKVFDWCYQMYFPMDK